MVKMLLLLHEKLNNFSNKTWKYSCNKQNEYINQWYDLTLLSILNFYGKNMSLYIHTSLSIWHYFFCSQNLNIMYNIP